MQDNKSNILTESLKQELQARYNDKFPNRRRLKNI